jgi:anti-sigma B factor antagonist
MAPLFGRIRVSILGARLAVNEILAYFVEVPVQVRPDGPFSDRAVVDTDGGPRYRRCMGLEYFDWEVGDVTVLHLQGPITLGEATSRFRNLIHEFLDAGKRNIVLNLGEVYYIDSSGLGELVAAFTTTAHRGGTLKLAKLTKKVQDVVQLTKVYRVFDVFPDEETAVRSFSA